MLVRRQAWGDMFNNPLNQNVSIVFKAINYHRFAANFKVVFFR